MSKRSVLVVTSNSPRFRALDSELRSEFEVLHAQKGILAQAVFASIRPWSVLVDVSVGAESSAICEKMSRKLGGERCIFVTFSCDTALTESKSQRTDLPVGVRASFEAPTVPVAEIFNYLREVRDTKSAPTAALKAAPKQALGRIQTKKRTTEPAPHPLTKAQSSPSTASKEGKRIPRPEARSKRSEVATSKLPKSLSGSRWSAKGKSASGRAARASGRQAPRKFVTPSRGIGGEGVSRPVIYGPDESLPEVKAYSGLVDAAAEEGAEPQAPSAAPISDAPAEGGVPQNAVLDAAEGEGELLDVVALEPLPESSSLDDLLALDTADAESPSASDEGAAGEVLADVEVPSDVEASSGQEKQVTWMELLEADVSPTSVSELMSREIDLGIGGVRRDELKNLSWVDLLRQPVTANSLTALLTKNIGVTSPAPEPQPVEGSQESQGGEGAQDEEGISWSELLSSDISLTNLKRVLTKPISLTNIAARRKKD